MDAISCIKERMSIRKFKSDPVPKEIIIEVLEAARWSPSYKNSQPWEVVVVSGKKKEELTRMLLELLEKDEKPNPDFPEPKTWPEAEAKRIEALMVKRAKAFGRSLVDPVALKEAKKANFSFYGAPYGIFLFQDASLGPWSIFDIGLFAQSLMIAAKAKGLGTVPQAFLADYAPQIKKFLSVPETKRLVIGISIGYPDMEAPENSIRSDRAELTEFVRWVE